jgi:polyphenol oxidase
MSVRTGGVSPEPLGMNLSYRVGDDPANVVVNRTRFFGSIGFPESRSAIPHQCHSDNVQLVSQPGEYESCDGLVTQTKGLPLIVTIADCLPVVLYDPLNEVLSVVHAGWRGTAQGIVAAAVDLMVGQCGAIAGGIVAYLGPSAGVCCYEVGHEVAEVFSLDQVEQRDDRLYLNLKKVNSDQLLSVGLNEKNIEVSPSCTICTPQLFHSHRRDRNQSGRMMAAACLLNGAGS